MAEMEEGEEEDDRRGTPENDMGERSGMGPPSTPEASKLQANPFLVHYAEAE